MALSERRKRMSMFTKFWWDLSRFFSWDIHCFVGGAHIRFLSTTPLRLTSIAPGYVCLISCNWVRV